MRVEKTAVLERNPFDGARRPEPRTDAEHELQVRVIYTTPAGTVAALRAAADLATNLQACITLVVAEPVPMHFSLDRPHVPVDFLERRNWALICEAGLVDQPVDIKICLCRNARRALKQVLGAHSLIVIGGGAHWWNRTERRLANWLGGLGHHVIFVSARDHGFHAKREFPGRQEAFLRTLDSGDIHGCGI